MPSQVAEKKPRRLVIVLSVIAALFVAVNGLQRDIHSYAASPKPTWEPTQEEADLDLTSVLRRKADVLASNSAGLFRAELSTKQWRRLTIPDHMPIGGAFGDVPEDSSLILYSIAKPNLYNFPRASIGSRSKNKAYKFGMYQSKNDGHTWDLVSENDNFGQVVLLPNGTLFGLRADWANKPPPIAASDRLFTSKDHGKTWKDISMEGGFGMHPYIFPDPDHADLVCVQFSGIRICIAQAQDERFQWKTLRLGQWKPPKRGTTLGFSRCIFSTAPTFYSFEASLGNYFSYDFGSGTFLAAFDIVPAHNHFELHAGQTVSIPVSIVFREDFARCIRRWKQLTAGGHSDPKPTSTSVQIVDQKIGLDCWGIRVEHNGKRTELPVGLDRNNVGYDRKAGNAIKEKLRKHDDWQSVQISESSPYHRTINLSKLFDFSDPGEYQVQLVFDNSNLGCGDGVEWVGGFDSPVFTVVVIGRK